MASEDYSNRPKFNLVKSNGKEIISIQSIDHNKEIQWQLPPSKSHLIRTLLIASQSEQFTMINGINNCGEDARSMKKCLMQLGVVIDQYDIAGEKIDPNDLITEPYSFGVHGVGQFGFIRPDEVLNVGNSGTTLRLLALLCARFDFPITIDGDKSIRKRDTSILWDSLKSSGVNVLFNSKSTQLPVQLNGPWFDDCELKHVILDISKSSQPFSAWMISGPGLPHSITLELQGQSVSNRHWMLSKELCQSSGANIELDGIYAIISAWEVTLDSNLLIPRDASMASFAMLAVACLDVKVNLIGWPRRNDCLGHEILQKVSDDLGISWSAGVLIKSDIGRSIEVDLSDSNDLITPLSIIMALGHGGTILGAKHSSYKESNRLESTSRLLQSFGMISKINDDGLEIPGAQIPSTPNSVVDTFGDHRVFMSALLLACKVGANIEGFGLHNIADQLFIERLIENGII